MFGQGMKSMLQGRYSIYIDMNTALLGKQLIDTVFADIIILHYTEKSKKYFLNKYLQILNIFFEVNSFCSAKKVRICW
jgi:hypothetical protein